MSDLLDVQGEIRQLTRFTGPVIASHTQQLQCIQKMEHRAVVDREWRCRCVEPGCTRRSSFEKWETIRIEQAAPKCGQTQRFVFDTTIDGTEGSEQSRPGVLSTLEHFDTNTVGLFP
ncbi:MAG: hypothetical protein KGS09_20690 [Nitrospirae bacterium]|nr:hypothetical protein [Nitrospirota bacterium]